MVLCLPVIMGRISANALGVIDDKKSQRKTPALLIWLTFCKRSLSRKWKMFSHYLTTLVKLFHT